MQLQRILFLLVLSWFLMVTAGPAAAAGPLQFAHPRDKDGAGGVYLTVRANTPQPALTLTITGAGQAIERQLPAMAAGEEHQVRWTQDSGQAQYAATVRGNALAIDYQFSIGSAGPAGLFEVLSSWHDLVDRRQITLRSPANLDRHTWEVWDIEGKLVDSGASSIPVAAGGQFVVSWSSTAPVFVVKTKGFAEHEYIEHQTVPWSISIPHRDVLFDTGKWNIRPSEAPKLDETVRLLAAELAKLARVNAIVKVRVEAKLFVVGYTDTVGKPGDNQILSEKRARSIAEYLRNAGVNLPIQFAGMGESGLAVPTKDNVPQIRNRRALYILTAQTPPPGAEIPAQWRAL